MDNLKKKKKKYFSADRPVLDQHDEFVTFLVRQSEAWGSALRCEVVVGKSNREGEVSCLGKTNAAVYSNNFQGTYKGLKRQIGYLNDF